MPNWCNVDIEIKGRHKLLKKINRLLTQTNEKYNSIPNMDYGVLFKLDALNVALNKDDNVIWYCNELCKEKNVKLEDIMEFGYKFVQKPSSMLTHSLWSRGNQCSLFKGLVDLYLTKDEPRESFNCDKLLFTNISPDNPLSFYREDMISKFKFKEDSALMLDISDWYNSRVDKRWGTKWEPEVFNTILEDDTLIYNIETAWCPCTEFLLYLSELYDVKIIMRYREDGAGFAGRSEIEDGECDQVAYYEYGDNIIENEAKSYEAYFGEDMCGDDLFNTVYAMFDIILDDYIVDEISEKYVEIDEILKHDKGARKHILNYLKRADIPKRMKKQFKDCLNEYYSRKVKIKRLN